MMYVHPFPARMAPEIALEKLGKLKPGQKVLDPMVGSGMVLNTASHSGLRSFGVDLDPLAVLISKVSSTRIDSVEARNALQLLLEKATLVKSEKIKLSWIDEDKETQEFINYWFDKKQIEQLRCLSYYLIQKPLSINEDIKNVLMTALSRLIITKEPKASLARDTAHSRPHRVIEHNAYDIFAALPGSLNYVLKAIKTEDITYNSKTCIGDARNLAFLKNEEFDFVISSPPYINAIDYMRGNKFSLVWFGYTVGELRNIRSTSIGTKKATNYTQENNVPEISQKIKKSISDKVLSSMIQQYSIDLYCQLQECFRVLKPNAEASFVIGNCNLKGYKICNNEILRMAANFAGFTFVSEEVREIPNNRRYMPVNTIDANSLSKRIRTEYIITFVKPAKSYK